MDPGSDRFCDRWHQDYAIDGVDGIELQHLSRGTGFLGEELADQTQATAFAPRCTKDRIDETKVKAEAHYDGKRVLRTNTDLSADQVALKYKQLWQVERVFRDVKSLLLTRPIFHQRNHTIRGHVFCSFLALVLRKELDRCLEQAGQRLEWVEIKQDLKAFQTVTIEESGKRFAIRSQSQGVCGKVFQAVGVVLPPTMQEL